MQRCTSRNTGNNAAPAIVAPGFSRASSHFNRLMSRNESVLVAALALGSSRPSQQKRQNKNHSNRWAHRQAGHL
jgi:hypothetical protein